MYEMLRCFGWFGSNEAWKRPLQSILDGGQLHLDILINLQRLKWLCLQTCLTAGAETKGQLNQNSQKAQESNTPAKLNPSKICTVDDAGMGIWR